MKSRKPRITKPVRTRASGSSDTFDQEFARFHAGPGLAQDPAEVSAEAATLIREAVGERINQLVSLLRQADPYLLYRGLLASQAIGQMPHAITPPALGD